MDLAKESCHSLCSQDISQGVRCHVEVLHLCVALAQTQQQV